MTGTPLAADRIVAVLGAGTMGAGIARVAAEAGHTVRLYDTDGEAVDQAIAELRDRLEARVAKGKMSGDTAVAILGRIRPARNMEELADAALVIEAIVEDLGVKQHVFDELESIVADSAVLATNTSSLSVTAIAGRLRLPGRVVGMHFFNPAPVMPLVEIVAGTATDRDVAAAASATAEAWGKTPVQCTSTPGFIVNRVARPFYAEGLRLLDEGVANASTIDAIVTGGGGFRMGPFTLMDLVGLDVNLAVSKSVYGQTAHDPRFAPSVIQQSLVDAGRLGRKTGRGFFAYGQDEATAPADSVQTMVAASDAELPVVEVVGDLGHATEIVDRIAARGVELVTHAADEGPGRLRIGDVALVPTDGRTATELAATGVVGTSEVAVIDLVREWSEAERVAVAEAAQAGDHPAAWLALLLGDEVAVSPVGDAPGLVLMRIVTQLASVAADAVLTGVAGPEAIDTAMRLGTNYPAGPLEWADRLGAATVVTVLDNLRSFYGEDRYRASALLRRAALAGLTLRGGAT
jgi:3-hydroxybutyryl-CoA dehydrogenase